MKTAVILIIIFLIAILAVIVLFPKEKPSSSSPGSSKTIEIKPPAATGNVDDLVKATLAEISDEELLLEEESDTSFIYSDNQEISDFGQTINESDF